MCNIGRRCIYFSNPVTRKVRLSRIGQQILTPLSRRDDPVSLNLFYLSALILTTQPFRPFCTSLFNVIRDSSVGVDLHLPIICAPLRVSNDQRSDVPESECSSHNFASSSLSAQVTQRRKQVSCSSLVQGPCHLKPNRGEMERLSISTVLPLE